MAEREPQDAEVTLNTGKLLAIFLGLAVVCAVFFTMGYMLGRGGAPSAGKNEIVNTIPASSNSATKPSAGNKNSDTAPQTCVAGSANCPSSPSTSASNPSNPSPNKNPVTQTTPAAQQTPAASNTSSSSTSAKPATPSVSSPSATRTPVTGAYMVQVAAVSKQEDADALVQGLRRKQYPVFVVNNVPGDPLFHIQVGPFTDAKEAEAMRSRLISEGYSAIVKK